MRQIQFLIKPASCLCNLRCKYCFYEDESSNRQQKNCGIMRSETVETLLREAYRMVDRHGRISFAFQGGEPTVAGIAFFQRFTERARQLCPKDVSIIFSIQTNGILLDEDWCRFFHDHHFLVGISVDGFKDLHNLHRIDAQGKGTWNAVSRKIAMLQKYKVEINALCVVTGACARSPQKVYTELKKMGFRYLQFIACLDPYGQKRNCMPYSLSPEAYGKFLCSLFDLWYNDWKNGQYHSIRLFDDYIHILLGEECGTCATCGRCGGYFVVEADGSVYPCDFFALDQWKSGALGEQSLLEIVEGDIFQRFLQWSAEKPEVCKGCPWFQLCGGGCKNDWENGQNYYCSSFQMLFQYALPRMQIIVKAEQTMRAKYTHQ